MIYIRENNLANNFCVSLTQPAESDYYCNKYLLHIYGVYSAYVIYIILIVSMVVYCFIQECIKVNGLELAIVHVYNYPASCIPVPVNYCLPLTGTPYALSYLLLGEKGFYYRTLGNTILFWAAGGLLVNLHPALIFSIDFLKRKNKPILLGKIPQLQSQVQSRRL